MRRFALPSAFAALILAGVVTPVATYAEPGSALAGVTVITADQTARQIVDLPRAVRVSYDKRLPYIDGLSIVGPGRIVGLALVSATDPTETGFAEMRMRSCFHRACTRSAPKAPDELLEVDWNASPPPQKGATDQPTGFSLPAGRYQLSVYTDGAPVRITWHIPGLTGHAALHPLLRQHAEQTTPAEHAVGGTPATPASTQAAGTGSVATTVGIFASAHFVGGTAHVTNDSWWCIYHGNGPPGGVVTQGCPGGDGIGLGATYVATSFGGLSYGLAVDTGAGVPGRYFQAVDDTGVQLMTSTHDTLLWADAGIPTQHR